MGPEGKLVQRPMSISSPSTDLSEYEFFIRLVLGGAFTPLLWELKLGDPINIKGPKGKFLLQDDGNTCFWVATGTGLAPFMSMLDTLRANDQQRDIVLLHGVSYDHDLAWRGELQDLADDGRFPLRYAATVSRPQSCPDWSGLTGRAEAVIEEQMDEHGLTPHNTTLYLCGNPGDGERGGRDRHGPRLPGRAGPQGAVLAEGPHPLGAPAMDDRFYLTTAIFYPSPGAAAALAVRGHRGRCHRALPPRPGAGDPVPDRHGRALGTGGADGAAARQGAEGPGRRVGGRLARGV